MNIVIAWFIRNPVASNLLMVVLVLGGLLALPQIHQEEFPSVDVEVVRISIEYPGATPEESEESLCIRIEEEIESVPDIDRLGSIAVELMFVWKDRSFRPWLSPDCTGRGEWMSSG